MEGQPDDEIMVVVPPAHQAGVWANWAAVDDSDHEVTVDFVRVDHSVEPNVGTVVARVAMSPRMLRSLIDQLSDTWDQYAAGVYENLLSDDPDDGAS
jgi:Protein of unknown function (DUF3467)